MRRARATLLYAALRLAEIFGRPRLPRFSRCAANPPLPGFNPGVSVIIPERANPNVLAECLEKATLACRELSEPSEVIVVVSGSPAALYRSMRKEHPRVRWLFLKQPLWYCGAVRAGLRTARFDWVYLLNSDMMLDALALESILKWRSPRVFAVASQVFFRDPTKRREETGWTTFRSLGGPIEILDEVPDDDISVRGTFYAGGGASLFRRDLLQDLARASSVYAPFYWEDVEWGVRAWRRGYESLYCPASKAWHLHRMTNRLFFPEAEIDRILARNRLVFHFRNGPPFASFRQFWHTLDGIDPNSLREILTFRRMSQMALGRFESCRLPSGPIALECTWQVRRGLSDECRADPPLA